jgi:glycosyltransferase involved in cell wall biosynthesis
MKVSIVTASFNQGCFIRDCIESVKSQTGVEWEHIVQDAGSTDETLAVLKEYPHLKWVSEKDQGMSDGINRGFRKATGDWVMWLNTDDYLLPGALARLAAFAGQHPEADLIYGNTDFVDATGKLLRHKREHAFYFNILLYYIQSTATFIRRRVLEAGHFLNVDYRVCMDFEYYVRLSRLGYCFAHLPVSLAAFRWHATNTSTVQSQRRREERLRVQRDYLSLTGHTHLQSEWMLDLLCRAHQLLRVPLKLAAHWNAR